MRIVVVNNLDLKAELAKIKRGIEQGLDDAANEAKNEFLRPAETWDGRPTFEVQRGANSRTIFTQHQHYVWVNYGTNRHGRRTVAGNRALHLPASWEPKTSPMDRSAGEGDRTYVRGENLFRSVPMSSITARRWDTLIADEFEAGLLRKIVQQAINRAQ